MTPDEIFEQVLRDDRVFELICRGSTWRAFYRSLTRGTGGEGFYRSVTRPTAREAVTVAYEAWVTDQVKNKLVK